MLISLRSRRSLMVAVSFGLCCSLTVSAVSASIYVAIPNAPRQTITQPYVPIPDRTATKLPASAQKLYSSIPGTLKLQFSRLNALSETLMVEDLQHQVRNPGAISISTAIALNNLAAHLVHYGSFSRAETYYLRAIIVLEQCKGDNEIAIAIVQQNLAEMYAAERHFLPALSLYRKAVATLERRLGAQHDAVRAVQRKYDALRVRFISVPFQLTQ